MFLMKVKGTSAAISTFELFEVTEGLKMQRNLKRAGLFVQRESMKIVPVDEGNLKGSAYTRSTGLGFNTEVEVGYTAEYAIYVHENLEARHSPGQTAKFLERVVKEQNTRIQLIIKGLA